MWNDPCWIGGRRQAQTVVVSAAKAATKRTDAADAAGMSRRYGGIHFAQGDLIGRSLGRVIGAAVWTKAKTCFDGTAYRSEALPESRPRQPARVVRR